MAKINGKDIIGVITKGRLVKLQKKTVTPTASVQTIKPDAGYDGMSEVTINKYVSKSQKKTVTPKATVQVITPDAGYDSLSEVIVNPGYENSISAYLDKSLTKVTASDLATINALGEQNLSYSEKGIFQEFNQLTSVVVPENVTYIGERVFYKCENLVSVVLPDSMTELGDEAFGYCLKLENINAPASLKKIGTDVLFLTKWYVNQRNLHDPNMEDIYFGKHLFRGYPNSRTSTIKPDTIGIAGNAFQMSDIKSITIPNKVTYIGTAAFSNASLTTVTFDNDSSLKEIGEYAFGSSNITSIIVPATVTEVGDNAFTGCQNLTNVSFLGNGIESLYGTFENDIKLKTVSLPLGLKKLEQTFVGCNSLASITIPETVTKIGYSTFAYCTALTSITIPENVTEIDTDAFYGCSSLSSVIMLPITPPYINSSFNDCSSELQITVPAGCGNAYKAANGWSEYADKIVEATV